MANTQTFVADVNLNAQPAINQLDLLDKHIKQLEKTSKQQKKAGDLLGMQETKEEIERTKEVITATRKEIQSVSTGFNTAGKSVKGLENALKLATLQWERLSDPKDRAKMAAKIRNIFYTAIAFCLFIASTPRMPVAFHFVFHLMDLVGRMPVDAAVRMLRVVEQDSGLHCLCHLTETGKRSFREED